MEQRQLLAQTVIDAVAAPVLLVSEDGKLLAANAAFVKVSERAAEGRGVRELVEPRQCVLPEAWKNNWRGSVVVKSAGASLEYTLESTWSQDLGCAVLSFAAPVSPLSPDLHLRSQRLEQLGTLAGGVAHDMNNVLTGVLGHVSYLRLALKDSGDVGESLVAIEDGARRAASMTQQILKFAKAGEGAVGIVNLCEVVRAGVHLLKGALPKNITLKVYGDSRPLCLSCDEGRLSQVFMNLVINARDAMPSGGTIEVTLSRVVLDNEFCEIYPQLSPGEFIRLIISDNGMGMPPEVQERIFEPFYTTKAEGGTGLGLATVGTIVREIRGVIECTSSLGQGTRFDIFLPAADVDEVGAKREEEVALPGGSERILVVDDEEVVRTVMQRSLEHLGYQVDVAQNGPDALSKFRHDRHAYGLVILDMMMPKMAGDEVFRRLKELDPDVRVLLASGYTSEGRARSVLDSGGLGFVQKPFAVEELAREVRRCLDH
ncbi:MAG: response regulator [Bdellovibrionales bacterium]|nr:response regulator [Bdellovibrionales bacterium]